MFTSSWPLFARPEYSNRSEKHFKCLRKMVLILHKAFLVHFAKPSIQTILDRKRRNVAQYTGNRSLSRTLKIIVLFISTEEKGRLKVEILECYLYVIFFSKLDQNSDQCKVLLTKN